MTTTIASASVRIGPDLAGFRAELEAEVESALATVRANVNVGADTKSADLGMAEVSARADRLGAKSVTVSVKTDTHDSQHQLGLLATSIITLGPSLVPITAELGALGIAGASAFGAVALGAGVAVLGIKDIKAQIGSELTPAVKDLQAVAGAGLLPGVQQGVSVLLTELPNVRGLVRSVANELGTLTAEGSHALGGSGFKSFFDYVDHSAGPILDQFGHVIGNTAETITHLVVAFAPVTNEIGQGLESLTAHMASASDNSQGLRNFVSYIASEGPQVVHTLADAGAALIHVGAALAPVGHLSLEAIDGVSKLISIIPGPVLTTFATDLVLVVAGLKAWNLATSAYDSAKGALFKTVPADTAALANLDAAMVTTEASTGALATEMTAAGAAASTLAAEGQAANAWLATFDNSVAVTTETTAALGAELTATEAYLASYGAEAATAAAAVGALAAAEDTLAASAEAADTAMALNPVTLGLVAVGTVLGVVTGLFGHASAAAQQAKQEAQQFAASLDTPNIGNSLDAQREKITGIRDELAKTVAEITASRPVESFGSRSTVGPNALDELRQAQTSFVQSQPAVRALNSALADAQTGIRNTRANITELSHAYGLNAGQVRQVAAANNIDLRKSLQTVIPLFANATATAAQTHRPLSLIEQDVAGIGNKALTASQQLSYFNDLLNQMAGDALSTDAAALTFKDDVAQLEGALKASGGSLDANTTSGRAAAEALNAAATQALAVASATEKQTGSSAKARNILKDEISVLEATAGHSNAARNAIDLLRGALNKIPDTATHANEGFQANAGQIAKNARQAADQATAAIQHPKVDPKTAGASLAQGYADGITSGTNAVVNAAVALATKAVQAVRDTQQSKSPAKATEKEGHNHSTGYAQGIIAGTPEATKAASSMASKATAAAVSEAKKNAAAAKAFAQSLATYIAATDQYVTTTFASDLASTPHAIRSGVKGLEYRLETGDRHGFISTAERKQLDAAIDMTGSKLILIAHASDAVTKELGHATSALSSLRSAAQQVASSTASGLTGLGDPSQFASVTSGAGVLQVEGRQVAVARQFAATLGKLRNRHLDKRVYQEISTEGPGDLGFASLLAGMSAHEFAQFNRGESTLGSLGRSAGASSSNYLFGRAIHEQQQVVRELTADRHQLHQDTERLIHQLDHLVRNGLQDKGTHGLLRKIDKDTRQVGTDVSKAMNNVASARKKTRRALVAGARG